MPACYAGSQRCRAARQRSLLVTRLRTQATTISYRAVAARSLQRWTGTLQAKSKGQGKFRGPDFEPLALRLVGITCDKLKDSKDRNVPTVIAEPISDAVREELAAEARTEEDAVLVLLLQAPGGSLRSMAEALGWFYKNGKAAKQRVHDAMRKLQDAHLVRHERGEWGLTDKGKKVAQKCA
jgi:hypothetical protein